MSNKAKQTAAGLACALAAIFLVQPGAAATAAPKSLLNAVDGYGEPDAVRDITPLALGALFCKARQSGDMAGMNSYLSPKLKTLLAEATSPDEVPWQSFPGMPLSCSLSVVNGFDNTIGVLVAITYESPERRWSDVLNLERTPDSWRLNNIFYADGGNLRFTLFEDAD
jgi:hypothetical protein